MTPLNTEPEAIDCTKGIFEAGGTEAAAPSDTRIMPDLSHLSMADYQDVYEPAEDTFLFLDTFEKERDFLTALNPSVCLEIGCGTGTLSTGLWKLLRGSCSQCLYLATDINHKALTATRRTADANGFGAPLELVEMDLFNGVAPHFRGLVDVLFWNPPYVPTPPEEVGTRDITASWAGGKDGRVVIDRLLPQLDFILSATGVFYLLVVKENKPTGIALVMKKRGFKVEPVCAQQAYNEAQSVLKFTRTRPPKWA
jgi:release factor glutamine methyltransferase